jgi:crossover junction endodeoxyribonuclease RuvC
MKRIVGIDPGAEGAFCILTIFEETNVVEVSFEPMPIIRSVAKTNLKNGKVKTKTTTQLDFVKLAELFQMLLDATFFIEKVNAMPKQGVVSMFNFGQQIGALRALLHANRIPHHEVTPQAWQKVMHEGAPAGQDPKQRSLIIARRLFPAINLVREGRKFPDEGFIDALLIADYGRRKLETTRD